MPKKDLLREYHQKRDFEKTSEPAGKARAAEPPKRIFVVQEHHATRLHYDFRLELGGVLKSWAVPKGLPQKTNEKRLAVQTEDHPIDYANFQGHIPKGSYGAGEVIIWDRGTYRNLRGDVSVTRALEEGRVTFWLDGEKARGAFALVKTRTKGVKNEEKQWLLIKLDDHKTESEGRVPRGVSLLEKGALTKKPSAKERRGKPAFPAEAKKIAQPDWIDPMLATLTSRYFSNSDWVYERKLDGERCLIFRSGRDISLLSRNRNSLDNIYPELMAAVGNLEPDDFILDGEIVAFDGSRTSFAVLQSRLGVRHPNRELIESVPVFLYVFDILYFDGHLLTGVPLEGRKKILEDNFDFRDPLRPLEYIRKEGLRYYQAACKRSWEGVIAKRYASVYKSKRSDDWLKFKCSNQQEFVIGGYTEPAGSRVGLGAILIGYYEGNDFIYAGKVGTGFDVPMLQRLIKLLSATRQDKSPFSDENLSVSGVVHWVKPKYVTQITFSEWTRDGMLRHPRFKGLRDDKNPKDVVRERPKE